MLQWCDWILAGALLNFNNAANYDIALVTAHNALVIYHVEGGTGNVSTYHSEVNCILYPFYNVLDTVVL